MCDNSRLSFVVFLHRLELSAIVMSSITVLDYRLVSATSHSEIKCCFRKLCSILQISYSHSDTYTEANRKIVFSLDSSNCIQNRESSFNQVINVSPVKCREICVFADAFNSCVVRFSPFTENLIHLRWHCHLAV